MAGESVMLQAVEGAGTGREPSDQALALARLGDHGAFAELVGRHQAMVFSLAYHFTRNRAIAEELAQDVFLELFRNLARLESAAHVTFWLRRVTSHRCIDRARRERHRPEHGMTELPEAPVAPVTRDPWMDDRLRALVAELPARARMVVTLRYQEDLDPAEIGRVLDMPVNTVKSHLRRSLAFLRTRVAGGSAEA